MAEQLELVPAEPKLTDRQRYALELLEQYELGASAVLIGLAWHTRRGKHDGRQPCAFCESDGRGVLTELRRKGLVVRRRSGLWQSLRIASGGSSQTSPAEAASASSPPSARGQSNVIPF